MLPIYSIIFFGLIFYNFHYLLLLAPLMVMILNVGINIKQIVEPLSYLEKKFKLEQDTKEAEFFIKNNRWYLAISNEKNIQIYDIQKGNIVIQNEEAFKLLLPDDTFIVTYSRTVENRKKIFLIKLWDINTHKSIFSCLLDDFSLLLTENKKSIDLFFLTENKKYFLCCNIKSERKHEYDEGYFEWWEHDYVLKIWEIKSGQLIYNQTLYVGSKYASDKDTLKRAINNILKSYKDAGKLDESDKKENISLPYKISIIFPSCERDYNGSISYDMSKVRHIKFTERAIYIKARVPLNELK